MEYESGLKYVGEERVIYFDGVDDRELILDNTEYAPDPDAEFFAIAFVGTPGRDLLDITDTPPGARVFFLDFSGYMDGDVFRGDSVRYSLGTPGHGEWSRADAPTALEQFDLDWLRENDFIDEDERPVGWEVELEGRQVFLGGVEDQYDIAFGVHISAGAVSVFHTYNGEG